MSQQLQINPSDEHRGEEGVTCVYVNYSTGDDMFYLSGFQKVLRHSLGKVTYCESKYQSENSFM